MILTWILYALLVGILVAGAARVLERACRLVGRPVRWIWAGAVGLTLILVGIAPLRAALLPDPSLVVSSLPPGVGSEPEGARMAGEGLLAAIDELRRDLDVQIHETLLGASRLVPPWLDRGLLVLWGSLSGLLALALGTAYRRVHHRVRDCPSIELDGVRVRLAPGVGPAVIGLREPEIVVPEWLLSLSEAEQRLVLVHEREHIGARDPLLLIAACAGAILLPWHPAIHWMLARLRLTVELDCDARVLRRGVSRRAYGTLLIDLARRDSGFRLGATAFAEDSSHLQRRLLAMKQAIPRFPLVRAGVFGVLALLALMVACEARLPTSEEVENMDVAAAERGASLFVRGDPEAVYTIDGEAASAEEAHALTPEEIGQIEVVKRAATGERTQVRITTRQSLGDSPAARRPSAVLNDQEFDGIILIDGVRSSAAAMRALSPERIKSVEVIKGPAAARAFPAPEAVNGLIRITTHGGVEQH